MSETRQQSFDGEIKNCPNCGAILPSMAIKCPECGYELRNVETTNSMKQFYDGYMNSSYENKISFISSFPVPNTKEDFIEFLSMAVGEINKNMTSNEEETGMPIRNAWISKLGQMKAKAPLLFSSDPAFLGQIEKIIKSAKIKKLSPSAKFLIGDAIAMIVLMSFLLIGGRLGFFQ